LERAGGKVVVAAREDAEVADGHPRVALVEVDDALFLGKKNIFRIFGGVFYILAIFSNF
jgi:hypothetical protein